MKNILIAVDETKASKDIFDKCIRICKCMNPDLIMLVYVERYEGRSLMTAMLQDESELATLKEVLEGTDYKEALDKKAETILTYYKNILEERPPTPRVETIVRMGHPADEILETAQEKNADIILIGSAGKRVSHLFMGSVSREVVNRAEIPVLVVR
jgi:nucleotide-binding universal stress UspA family protein